MFFARSSAQVGDECDHFALRVSDEPDTHVIEVYGELDVDTAPLMASRIVEGEDTTSHRILVDLSGVDFMASAGMAVLVEADARSRNNGHRLAAPAP